MTMRQITHDAFLAELEAQGVPRDHYAFICPACGTVQSYDDFKRAGVESENAERAIGFNCVGRYTNAPAPRKAPDGKPCNWSLGGLFRIHQLEVKTEDGTVHPFFEVAAPEQARAHLAQKGGAA